MDITIKILKQGWTNDHNFSIDIEELLKIEYEIIDINYSYGEYKVMFKKLNENK